MSVLVYAESDNGKFKKTTYEAISYAKGIADKIGTSLTALAINVGVVDDLGRYGAEKVLVVSDENLENFSAAAYADVIGQAAKKEGAEVVVIGQSANDKYLAPFLAINLGAGYASNAVALPENTDPFQVKRSAFTNKGFNTTEIKTDIKLVGISKNAYGVKENNVEAKTEEFKPELDDKGFGINLESIDKARNKVTIADAEIVVSGGRGLKGPENWGMLEDLAETLGAALACSKPVSDMDWRPHTEHVGQTGKPVAANLYIAVGISGAIQHLAGVNASKYKLVINNDAEAPFFKSADYGIVGDAFEIVPKLNEKIKQFKAENE